MSLIEILVGVAIALVATLVIFQVFASSNAANRSTDAGNEAQISGNIGMFQIERDLKAAGMGFGTLTSMSSLGVACNATAINPAQTPANFTFPLVPVVITPNGAAPDQINVLYGDSAFMTAGRTYNSGTATNKTMAARGGIQQGDLAVVTNSALPPTACELVEITANTNADGASVDHVAGAGYTSFYSAAATVATHNSAGTPASLNGTGVLYNLGPQPVLNQYQVLNNALVVTNLLGSNGGATAVAEGVVQLKAQYGIDDGTGGAPAVAGDGIISSSEWQTAAPGVPADWSKVLAVRFALLARSSALEKTAVTTVNPAWVGGNFDMTGIPNWQNYRYRVFESVVAMRNMLWGK